MDYLDNDHLDQQLEKRREQAGQYMEKPGMPSSPGTSGKERTCHVDLLWGIGWAWGIPEADQAREVGAVGLLQDAGDENSNIDTGPLKARSGGTGDVPAAEYVAEYAAEAVDAAADVVQIGNSRGRPSEGKVKSFLRHFGSGLVPEGHPELTSELMADEQTACFFDAYLARNAALLVNSRYAGSRRL